MSRKVKSEKRVKFINEIIKCMKKNVFFRDDIDRTKDDESNYQRAFFTQLEVDLPKIYSKVIGIDKTKAKEIAKNDFKFERKPGVTVNNFNFFGTGHRPDANLPIDKNVNLVIEIKKGAVGSDLRAGIGQALIYSQAYDFVLFVFVDTSPERAIREGATATKAKELIKSLWDMYNIKFLVM
jgi:hypothetical protein